MSIGLAIFLSAAVLSAVVLYGLSRDRLNWSVIARRTSYGLLFVIVVGGGLISSLYLWRWVSPRIWKQTTYDGLQVGMQPNDVEYVLGPPTGFWQKEAQGEWKGFETLVKLSEIPKSKHVGDYSRWTYFENLQGPRVELTFDPKTHRLVDITCYSSDAQPVSQPSRDEWAAFPTIPPLPTGDLSRCPPISEITDGSTEEAVVRKFGNPDSSRFEGLTKTLFYKKLGVHFTLSKQVVYMLGVNDTIYVLAPISSLAPAAPAPSAASRFDPDAYLRSLNPDQNRASKPSVPASR